MRPLAWYLQCCAIIYTVTLLYGIETANRRENQESRSRLFEIVKGKVLVGHVISSSHVTSSLLCGSLCTADPSCRSYNYRQEETGEEGVCELSDATKTADPNHLVTHAQYDYYHDVGIQVPRSCLDLLRLGFHTNGIYNITEENGTSFPVFCDFHSEKYSAWTLVLSYSIKNKQMNYFCSKSFDQDWPSNGDAPNWDSYRLSLPRMQQLVAESTHWRSTTGFPVYGVDYRDYVRGNFRSFDIMNYEGDGECKDVEYVNIRGIEGRNTKVSFSQKNLYWMLSIESTRSGCPYKAIEGAVADERNFGYYCHDKFNSNFRGTINTQSTTQWWFGGYL